MFGHRPIRTILSAPFNVTTTSQLVLAANEQRKFAEFINNSDENIFLSFGSAAAVDDGVRISADGFSYEIDFANLWLGDVFAIHGGTGNKKLLIREWR
jgi:hypothetical protein